jgi:16S rRNA (cytidine1402-2'-O)-methyltransferase
LRKKETIDQMMLFLIPVPLADDTVAQVLPPQVSAAVASCDIFFVENLRTARRFISGLKLGKVIDNLTFYELNKDTSEAETLTNMKAVQESGRDAGVLSEAGCPGVADPGAVAVAVAHRLGITVVPLVGPSSLLLALMGSGMSGQSFVFHGYLPIERAARVSAILKLEKEALTRQQTQLFIETPYRNQALFEDILTNCAPQTRLCVACHLTAPDELIKTLSVQDWKKQKPDLHKKPTVFLIG